MKKITLSIALAGALIATQQTNAQGFLKKLASAMAPKPINGVWELAIGGDGKFATAQPQTQFKQFEHAKENADKKLEIQYDGIVCDAARFIATDIPKIYTDRENQPNWWLFQTKDSTFFMVNRMNNYQFKASENLIGVITSNKDLMKDIVGWDKKNEPGSALLKEQLKEVQNLCDKITKGFADKEAAKKAEDAAADAAYELPAVAPFSPPGVTQKVIADAFYKKFERAVDEGSLKLTYAYFGSHKIQRLKPLKEWEIIKEKKTVNGTYDNFITKRSIDVICVVQNSTDMKNGTYSLFLLRLYEDAAFGVYDGSKWSGTYYITGHNPADMYKPKDRMMKYKDVLK